MNLLNLELAYNQDMLSEKTFFELQKIVDNYFSKLQILMKSNNIPFEIGNILVIGQATNLLKTKDLWDELVYDSMTTFLESFLKGKITNLGFSYGLSYYSSIIHFYSKKTGYYKKFLNHFDKTILVYLEKNLDMLLENEEYILKTQDYDMISGISGVVQYLFQLPREMTKNLLKKVVLYLSNLTNI